MEKQIERQCRANAVFTDEAYLKTRYICREDGTYTIRVGRGERRDVLACKELYGKAVKTALCDTIGLIVEFLREHLVKIL